MHVLLWADPYSHLPLTLIPPHSHPPSHSSSLTLIPLTLIPPHTHSPSHSSPLTVIPAHTHPPLTQLTYVRPSAGDKASWSLCPTLLLQVSRRTVRIGRGTFAMMAADRGGRVNAFRQLPCSHALFPDLWVVHVSV